MSKSSNELCAQCPDRNRLASLLARVVNNNELAADCEGPVSVSRGTIVTLERSADEPWPHKSEFKWTRMAGDVESDLGKSNRYSRTDWSTEKACGQSAIEPAEDEVLYDTSMPIVNEGGLRYAAFIKGDEQQIKEHRSSMWTMALLDSLDDIKKAQEFFDANGISMLASSGGDTELARYNPRDDRHSAQ